MEFGVPRRREASSNNEKYENLAVITISEFKGKGTGRTITLNKKAIEGLGIDFEKEARISFSFNSLDESVVIANTTGLEGVAGVKLAKTSKSSSDKAYFEAIKKNFNVKLEDEVEFLMTAGEEFNGNKTFKLSILAATTVMESTVEEASEETAPNASNVAKTTEEVVDFPETLEEVAVEEPVIDNPFSQESPVEVPQEVIEAEAAKQESDLKAEEAELPTDPAEDFYSKFEDSI